MMGKILFMTCIMVIGTSHAATIKVETEVWRHTVSLLEFNVEYGLSADDVTRIKASLLTGPAGLADKGSRDKL